MEELLEHEKREGHRKEDDRLEDNIVDERFLRILIEERYSVGDENDLGDDDGAYDRDGRQRGVDAELLKHERPGDEEDVEHDEKEKKSRNDLANSFYDMVYNFIHVRIIHLLSPRLYLKITLFWLSVLLLNFFPL